MLVSMKLLLVMAGFFMLTSGQNQNQCDDIKNELDKHFTTFADTISRLEDHILNLESKIDGIAEYLENAVLGSRPDPQVVPVPELGKSYTFFNKEGNYDDAASTCSQHGLTLVQVPTEEEHLTLNQELVASGRPGCFWTGVEMVKFQNWQWKVKGQAIPVPPPRWTYRRIPSDQSKDKAFSLGPYLYPSEGGDNCRVVCQVEHSVSQEKTEPMDCHDVKEISQEATIESGLYLLRAPGLLKRRVYCNFTEKETWTTISRRIKQEDIFNRTWEEYKSGFGQATGDYWIGNEMLHQLTKTNNYYLRITMTGFVGRKISSYESFKVGNETSDYHLMLGPYDKKNSNGGDSFFPKDTDCNNNGATDAPFSTYDHGDAQSCSLTLSGGWWFTNCGCSNLNGKYVLGGSVPSSGPNMGLYWNTLYWDRWGLKSSLRTATMEIRRK